MADYYEVESRRDGSVTVTPRNNATFGEVLGGIVALIIGGLLLTHCGGNSSDTQASSSSSTTQQVVVQAAEPMDVGYTWLTDKNPINRDGLAAYDDYDTISNVDTELTHCIRAGTTYYGGSGEGWIEYFVDGDYKYLTGCMAVTETWYDTDYVASLVIYGDGEELYRINRMGAGDTPEEFQINISGVERIRIEHEGGDPFRVANLKLWTRTPN